MSVSRNKVNDFLMSAKTMIENALSDNAVKTTMASYGYNEDKLQAGKALYDEAFELDAYPPLFLIWGPLLRYKPEARTVA